MRERDYDPRHRAADELTRDLRRTTDLTPEQIREQVRRVVEQGDRALDDDQRNKR